MSKYPNHVIYCCVTTQGPETKIYYYYIPKWHNKGQLISVPKCLGLAALLSLSLSPISTHLLHAAAQLPPLVAVYPESDFLSGSCWVLQSMSVQQQTKLPEFKGQAWKQGWHHSHKGLLARRVRVKGRRHRLDFSVRIVSNNVWLSFIPYAFNTIIIKYSKAL